MTTLEAIAQLKRLSKQSKAVMKDVEHKVAVQIANDAILNAPVDQGELIASIGTDGSTVFAGASYAAYQEFGTGSLVEIPDGLEEEARQFFVNGKGHIPAHPYFFPAVWKNIESLIPILDEELQKIAE